MAINLELLRELPEFDHTPVGFKGSEALVYEIARITHSVPPQVQYPYNRQEVVHVVGRSPDMHELYVAWEVLRRADGALVPIDDRQKSSILPTLDIIRYEVLVSHANLGRFSENRRIG